MKKVNVIVYFIERVAFLLLGLIINKGRRNRKR